MLGKDKMYFYETFADQFDSQMNMYDTHKRLKVFFEELLNTEDLKGKELLDAGCGTGWFSQKACEKGAVVTSMDLGEGLLSKVAQKCDSKRVVGSVLEMPFSEASFEVVISSEVIEHTPDPFKALQEMYRVLRPGGILILSTPNKFWYWTLWVANILKIRPYQGLENWSSYIGLRQNIQKAGFNIQEYRGVHLIPFVHPWTYPINNFFHRWNAVLAPFMVNLVVKCVKN